MPSFSVQMDGARDYTLTLHISQGTQDVANNRSIANWSLVAAGTWGSYNNGATSWSVNIGGIGGSGSIPSANPNPSQTIASGSVWLGHNADGTLSFYSSAYWNANHSNIGAGNPGGTTTFSTIPRASAVAWADQGAVKYAGSTFVLNTNRASSGFTHDVKWFFGTQSGTVGTGIGASVSWTIPLSLLNEIPNASSGSGHLETKTYSGGTLIGTRNSGFGAFTPPTVIPTWTSVAATEGVPEIATKVGAFVQGLSKVSFAINGAAGVYNSTISQRRFQIENQIVDAASGTTPGVIQGSGTIPATFTVTDSRGQKKTQVNNLTVLPYSAPVIANLNVERALSTGVVSPDNGTYLKITLSAVASSLINGTQKNTIGVRIYSRLRGATTWVLRNTLNPAGIVYNSNFLVTGPFAVDQAHEVRVEVFDQFSISAAQTLIAVASVFMHWGPNGLGVNKYHEQGALDVGGTIYGTGFFLNGESISRVGTTAERNAIFGVPGGTVSAQVALANRQVVWFNTELGWEESYYAPTGSAGLTVRGLTTSSLATAGWYPVGEGPRLELFSAGGQAMTSATNFTNWDLPGTGMSYRTGPAGMVVDYGSPGYAFTYLPGRYEAMLSLTMPGGSGTGVASLRANHGLSTAWQVQQKPMPLLAGFGQIFEWWMRDIEMRPGALFFARLDSGTLTAGAGWSELSVKYLGPPLVQAA